MDRTVWEYAQVVEVRGPTPHDDRPHIDVLRPDAQSSTSYESRIYEEIEQLGADGWELVSVTAVSSMEIVHWLKRPTDDHWKHRPPDPD